MQRKFPDLTSEEAKAYDEILGVLDDNEDFGKCFRKLYRWEGRSDDADEEPPHALMPALRINPAGSPSGDVSQQSNQELIALEFEVWSPGWDIRDLWGLESVVRKAIWSKAAMKRLARDGGILSIEWTQGPVAQMGADASSGVLVGLMVGIAAIWLQQPA